MLEKLTSCFLCVFSDRGPAGEAPACRGRPRAAQSRPDAGAGSPGASGASGQRATRTTVAQKPRQERHGRGTPPRQRLQQLIVSDSWLHPIRINTALIDSTYRPITLTSERVTLPHPLLASAKLPQTGAILERPSREFRLREHWDASNLQPETTSIRKRKKPTAQALTVPETEHIFKRRLFYRELMMTIFTQQFLWPFIACCLPQRQRLPAENGAGKYDL